MRADHRSLSGWAIFITRIALASSAHHVITPPSLTILPGQMAYFNCTVVENSNCEEVSLYWRHKRLFQNGSEGDSKDIKNGGRYSIIYGVLFSFLQIKNVVFSDEGFYFCSNFCFGKRTRIIEQKSQLLLEAQPQVSITSSISLDAPDLLILTCSAVSFYPSNVFFTWNLTFVEVPHIIQQGSPNLLQNGSYSSSSTLKIRTSQWSSEVVIECVVNHSSLTQSQIKYIRHSGPSSGVGLCQLKMVLLSLGLVLMMLTVMGVHVKSCKGNRSKGERHFEERLKKI
ncbi:uncharacterized protein LOC120536741 [Polypterus senegalus]|uniref:uncharacterized protein LOC120536741 n=1 Tax=Polypterus senegalus TaxID=55291 RepID=UPI0019644868|nr:uncharacterized protein LOC120536741 [Polypterus senegalus]